MIVSHQAKLIFVHVHRTGGTTIANLLRNSFNDALETPTQHSNLKSSEASIFDKYPDYYSFGFVRNPWIRMLSWYALIYKDDRKVLEQERARFERFLQMDEIRSLNENEFHYNSLDYFSDESNVIKVADIFRFEDFKNETTKLLNKLGLPAQNMPTINASWHKNHLDYYTEKSQELIAQKCKKDIDFFNYSF